MPVLNLTLIFRVYISVCVYKMFRALLALGLTSQAHALFCRDNGDVCPEGSIEGWASGGGVQRYSCEFPQEVPPRMKDCPSGWIFKPLDNVNTFLDECQLNVPDAIKDDAVADCSVNMCPDGYVPLGGLCVEEAPMGLVYKDGAWVPHTCSTISENYKNGQCCQ